MSRKLRIIGGDWRRRHIVFPDVTAIRPTPDRVRETLFNWLVGEIHGARCLEPFCGSGILSIEALSRGAKHCTMVDQSKDAIHTLTANLRELNANSNRFTCMQTDARSWLKTGSKEGLKDHANSFDLIFLDPPFADDDILDLVTDCLELLSPDGYLYVETPRPLPPSDAYHIHKQKKAGAVHYALVQGVGGI